MYTLRLLGTPSLEGPEGRLSGRVAQERKLALMAVLARAEGRTLTRDSLAAVFWPESDQTRARHNVADGVWVIRSALGEGALLSHGNRLTLSPEVVATDVEAFHDALENGDLPQAAELYTGHFMEGFHISGAPGFEHWLDGERARLEAAHAVALEDLVRAALETGRTDEGLAWALRLSAADPLNSRLALLCMETLAAFGDAAGAIRHGERHGERLDEELGMPLPQEVEERIRKLRSTPPPVPAAATAPAPRPVTLPREAPTPSQLSRRARGPDRGASGAPEGDAVASAPALRPRWIPLPALVAGAAIVPMLLAWFLARPDPESPVPVVADRILVFAFENRTGESDLESLGRVAARIVIGGLTQAGVGEVISPPEVLGIGESPASFLTEEYRAGILVTGTIERHEGKIALFTTIATAPGFTVIAALDPVPFSPERPDGALARLSSRVVGTLAARLGQEAPEHPFVVRTPVYESYRVADRATELFLDGQFTSAASHYRGAYELDTTSVGYLLWEGISHLNRPSRADAWAILEEIRPRRIELGAFDAAQFDWLEARLLGDHARALRQARVAHGLHPHSGLGGFQLGRELNRSGYSEEAVHVLRQLDVDRGWLARFAPYWNNLATALHLLGRYEEELEVAEEGGRRHGTAAGQSARLRALAALGRTDELQAVLRRSPRPVDHALTAARALHRHGHDSLAVAVAEGGLRALAADPLPPGASASELSARKNRRARLLMAAGRLTEARALFLERLEEQPGHRDLLGWTGFLEARLGLEAEARGRIEVLEASGREPFDVGGQTVARAAIHAELGDDPALVRRLLDQSLREGWPRTWFHFTPLFDPVREHPDFQDVFEPRG